jgi:hypothetical protein
MGPFPSFVSLGGAQILVVGTCRWLPAIPAMVAPLGRRSSPSTRACFEFARRRQLACAAIAIIWIFKKACWAKGGNERYWTSAEIDWFNETPELSRRFTLLFAPSINNAPDDSPHAVLQKVESKRQYHEYAWKNQNFLDEIDLRVCRLHFDFQISHPSAVLYIIRGLSPF